MTRRRDYIRRALYGPPKHDQTLQEATDELKTSLSNTVTAISDAGLSMADLAAGMQNMNDAMSRLVSMPNRLLEGLPMRGTRTWRWASGGVIRQEEGRAALRDREEAVLLGMPIVTSRQVPPGQALVVDNSRHNFGVGIDFARPDADGTIQFVRTELNPREIPVDRERFETQIVNIDTTFDYAALEERIADQLSYDNMEEIRNRVAQSLADHIDSTILNGDFPVQEEDYMTATLEALDDMVRHNMPALMRVVSDYLRNANLDDPTIERNGLRLNVERDIRQRALIVALTIPMERLEQHRDLTAAVANVEAHEANATHVLQRFMRLMGNMPVDYSALSTAQRDELRVLLAAGRSVVDQNLMEPPAPIDIATPAHIDNKRNGKRPIKVRKKSVDDT